MAFAVINGNNAALAGLNPNTDAAYAETAESLAGQSYVNVFAVKPENAEADFVKALESCVYTQKVYDLIVERGFVPTFTVEAANKPRIPLRPPRVLRGGRFCLGCEGKQTAKEDAPQ